MKLAGLIHGGYIIVLPRHRYAVGAFCPVEILFIHMWYAPACPHSLIPQCVQNRIATFVYVCLHLCPCIYICYMCVYMWLHACTSAFVPICVRLCVCIKPIGSNFRLVQQVRMTALSVVPWGVWAMPTGFFLDFRPSEIVSGAIWK